MSQRIISPEEALVMLGIGGSATDAEKALLTVIIRGVEKGVKSYLGYDPVQKERTEFYPRTQARGTHEGRGVWDTDTSRAFLRQESLPRENKLQVQHIPLRLVVNLWEDASAEFGQQSGDFAAATKLTQGSGFYVQEERPNFSRSGLLLRDSAWPITSGTVKLQYVAGYTADELSGFDETPTTVSGVNITFNESARTIVRASGSWLDDDYREGTVVTVSGSTSNDGSYVVDSRTGTTLTLTSSASLTDEGPVSGVTVTGNPGFDASDLKLATLRAVQARFNEAIQWQKHTRAGFTAGVFESERLGDYSYKSAGDVAMQVTGMSRQLPQGVKEDLEEGGYVHWGLWNL